MKCLGHLLCSAGVGIDPKKLGAIRDWPRPITGDQLYSFLGFVNFVRNHVRHFADLTGPLESVKNNKIIDWTPLLAESFESTKVALARAPFLQYPDFTRPFHIACDASNTGVGGVLYQPKSVGEHVTADNIVAMVSKKLNESQQRYSAYKKELFGLVYCLRQFRTYIWGRTDTRVITDHKPLQFLLTSPNISIPVQLWLDVILDFCFEVEHRPGILNVIPDTLSRMYVSTYNGVWGIPSSSISFINGDGPISRKGEESADILPAETHSSDEKLNIDVHTRKTTVVEPTFLSEKTQYGCHWTTVVQPILLSEEVMCGKVLAVQNLTSSSSEASSHLLVEMEKRGVSVPPEEDRLKLIQDAHALGHFGREAVFNSLWHAKLWWPNIRYDIQQVIADCVPCSRFTVVKSGFNPAQYIHARGPWEHIQMDNCVHLPPSTDGFTTLFVVVDVFTGFAVLTPLKSTSTDDIARALWHIISMFGLPKIIQSDNGPEFVSEIMRALVKVTGVDHRLISPYNPRADGKVERTIGTVSMIIKKLLHGTDHYWPLFVPFAQYTYNLKVSSLTGSTPFSLMFGRQSNGFKDFSTDPPSPINLEDWKTHQEMLLSILYPAIGERILDRKDKMLVSLNRHRRTLLPDAIPTGSTVMLNDPHRTNKFEPKYIGPYTVVRRARNGAYVLKDQIGDILDRHVPADQLKFLTKRAPKKILSEASQEVYEVDHIVDHRGDPGHYEFLTRWKGYAAADDTWVLQADFQDDAVIREYWRKLGILRTSRSKSKN
jgi:transposase InsO family protein